jgi:hypothetical protein
MKILLKFTAFFIFAIILVSCNKDPKQTQSSLTNIDEEKKFALTLYGDEVKVIAKGDLLGNGKQSAIAAIVMKETDNSYWIRRGSVIQKEPDGWKVIMKMDEKLSTGSGEMISQVDAKNGYIIRFDSAKKPFEINIVMADETGKGSSDEAVLKWNKDNGSFEFLTPNTELPQ